MALPAGFNEFEHLQSVYRQTINQIIRQEFSDVEDDASPNITTPRGSLKNACLHKDNDSAAMTQMRTDLFYLILGGINVKALEFYGIPITTFHESVVFLPQVVLHFRETPEDAKAANRYPLRGQVGFRLLDKNPSKAEAVALGQRIKNLFATPKFRYKKGRVKVSYKDKDKGYQMILTVFDEAEARRVIQQTLEINNHTPDWELLADTESGRNFTVKRTKQILGKTVELPKHRQIGNVYFHHAELKIHGLVNDVILCDTSGRFPDALTVAL
jgi:hypothetical protein